MDRRGLVAIMLAICAGIVLSGFANADRSHPCAPVSEGIATCLLGKPVPWRAEVLWTHGTYYAPVDELAATLGAKAFVSADHKHITINGKGLSTTNGETNRLDLNGKVYVEILDAANAAGYNVTADVIKQTINITR